MIRYGVHLGEISDCIVLQHLDLSLPRSSDQRPRGWLEFSGADDQSAVVVGCGVVGEERKGGEVEEGLESVEGEAVAMTEVRTAARPVERSARERAR